MEFLLTGFTHEKDFRVFSFECIGTDRVWTKCTVRADLSVTRKYGIALQELPLLCRGLLDRREMAEAHPGGDNVSITFTEDEIRTLSDERAAARAAIPRRKPPTRPAPDQLGAAWRDQNPQLQQDKIQQERG